MKTSEADRNTPEQRKAVVAYSISGDGVISTTAQSVLDSAPGRAQLQVVKRMRQAKAHADKIATEALPGAAERVTTGPTD